MQATWNAAVMLSCQTFTAAVLVLFLPQLVASTKLLLVPLPVSSHVAAMLALSTRLEEYGGYEVHLAVSDAHVATARALADKWLPGNHHTFHTFPYPANTSGATATERLGLAGAGALSGPQLAVAYVLQRAEVLLGNTAALARLAALQPDLLIPDSSYSRLLSFKLQLPSIEYDVGTGGALLHSNMYGCQFHPAYLPVPGTFFPSNGMSLPQRALNTAAFLAMQIWTWYVRHRRPLGTLARRHNATAAQLRRLQPLLVLVNHDWALEPPRPVSPLVKYVGPLMPRPPAPLPPHLAAWLEGGAAAAAAEDAAAGMLQEHTGQADALQHQHHHHHHQQHEKSAEKQLPGESQLVVVMSFGTSLLAPAAELQALAAALAHCRGMRLLLRLRPEERAVFEPALAAATNGSGLPAWQLLIQEQLPQNDVLGHPAVAAFVTQAGYLSMQEAAYHAVPVLGIPFIIGQGELAAAAADQGRGLLITKQQLLGRQQQQHGQGQGPLLVAQALQQLVHNASYKAAAERVAARLRSHPVHPGKRAADWVEYAVRVKDAGPFLHTQGQRMPGYQTLLLDVAAVYIALLAAAAGLALGVAKLCCWVMRQQLPLLLSLARQQQQQLAAAATGGGVPGSSGPAGRAPGRHSNKAKSS